MAKHIVLCILLLSAGRVWADGSSEAEELVRQAIQLRKEGKNQTAFALLREAYGLRPTARTASQLGLVEMALNYWVEAETHLGEGLSSHENQWVEANRVALEGALREVQRHVAHVKISGGPDGSHVSVNGRVVGNTPLLVPVRVAAGRVDLTVQSQTGSSWSQTLVLEGASTVTVSVILGPPAPSVEPSTTRIQASQPEVSGTGSASGSSLRTWAVIAGIASLTSLAGAAVLAKMSADDRASFDGLENAARTERLCGAQEPARGKDAQCQTLYDDWQRERFLTFVSLGTAAAFAVTSGALFWSSSRIGSHHLAWRCTPDLPSTGIRCGGSF